MPRFSANLGFLWPELPLEEAIRAAASAGFDAVECHWPYDRDPALVRAALEETGLAMLGLNTTTGGEGRFGLLALTDEEKAARASIDQAVAYAAAIGAAGIHAMAGIAQGPEAEATFRRNLRYACDEAAEHGITILIEPINPRDMPGFLLNRQDEAHAIVQELGEPGLQVQMDLYHCQIVEGDLAMKLRQYLPTGRVGHLQIAGVPERHEPDVGELNYAYLFDVIDAVSADCGWQGWVGCEYRPARGAVAGGTSAGLGWRRRA